MDRYEISTKVSLILPIRNEIAYIKRTLSSVIEQDYPKENLEIIIVDGLSEDGTQDVVTDFIINHHDFTFIVLDNPKKRQ